MSVPQSEITAFLEGKEMSKPEYYQSLKQHLLTHLSSLTPSALYEALDKLREAQREESAASYVMCKSPPGSAFCIQELQAEAKESALIDLDFEWQGFRFRDSFTWSLANRNLEVMKAFALHTLEDLLGKDLDSRQAEDIDAFCTKVACEISKQAAAAEYLNCTPVIVGPKNTEGQIEEHIIRIHLDYGDSLVRIKDEFDWDLSSHLDEYLVELINRVDVFAESYVVEQELPYAYKPVISKLIKQQIQRKQCELFVRMRESIAKSSLLDKDSSKSSSRPLDPVPDTVTDWNPQNFLFNGSLEDVLGPMGQFKYASMEDVKDNVPGYLKARPRARILEHLKEAAHNAAEEKASDKTATEAMNELESNKSECSEGRASGLVIVVNKETMEVEVVGKDGKIENNLKKAAKKCNGKRRAFKKTTVHKPARKI